MEGLPCIHKPEKVARKAPTPEFLIPGQCFVLIAQSLQEARSMAAVPAHAALQVWGLLGCHWAACISTAGE